MRCHRASFVTALALPGTLIGLSLARASAAPAAWLDFAGTVPGESTDPRHTGWIDIDGFGVDTNRTISGGSATPPQVSEIVLTKSLDRASTPLFLAAVGGTAAYPLVTLDLNYGVNRPVARLEFANVLIRTQSFQAPEGADRAVETIALNFTKITYYYVLPDTTTAFTSYDMVKGKVTSGIEGTTNPDSDNDGMPDAWETTYGLNVGVNDAAGDADGDGLSNLDEYQLGTNPKAGTSFFKATLSAVPATPGSYQLTWNSVVGKAYVIEWSPNLTTAFTAVRTVTASSTTSTETLTNAGPIGFYRVRPQ
ncbi:type VI secretion system tube protein Hcp [Luteolibacter soli]|uniref:Type VI secretion system tube protein Hcp n=1 Tax=Luteolibacter soli TaxID=3135280 RepID=A0ABU9B2E3_9BACT